MDHRSHEPEVVARGIGNQMVRWVGFGRARPSSVGELHAYTCYVKDQWQHHHPPQARRRKSL